MADTITIRNGDENVETSLLDILDLDMGEVEEKRSVEVPAGLYVLTLTEWKDREIDGKDKEGNPIKKALLDFQFAIEEVRAVNNPEINPESLVGRKYYESFFLSSMDDVSFLKAMIADISGAPIPPKTPMRVMLDGVVGKKFEAKLKQKKDKNDSDKVYTNIDRKKIVAVG